MRATGVPTLVENDVNAAAFGASMVMGCADLAYLSIGTGVAAGLIFDGRLRRGAHGVAGEIGHLPVDPGGPACECGQRGCLETVASGAAIARRWPSDSAAGPPTCSPRPPPARPPRSPCATRWPATWPPRW